MYGTYICWIYRGQKVEIDRFMATPSRRFLCCMVLFRKGGSVLVRVYSQQFQWTTFCFNDSFTSRTFFFWLVLWRSESLYWVEWMMNGLIFIRYSFTLSSLWESSIPRSGRGWTQSFSGIIVSDWPKKNGSPKLEDGHDGHVFCRKMVWIGSWCVAFPQFRNLPFCSSYKLFFRREPVEGGDVRLSTFSPRKTLYHAEFKNSQNSPYMSISTHHNLTNWGQISVLGIRNFYLVGGNHPHPHLVTHLLVI